MKETLEFYENTQSLESNYTKMPHRGSKYTTALKHGQILYQNLHTRPKFGKKISVFNSTFRNSTHKYHIWYRICHFRGSGL